MRLPAPWYAPHRVCSCFDFLCPHNLPRVRPAQTGCVRAGGMRSSDEPDGRANVCGVRAPAGALVQSPDYAGFRRWRRARIAAMTGVACRAFDPHGRRSHLDERRQEPEPLSTAVSAIRSRSSTVASMASGTKSTPRLTMRCRSVQTCTRARPAERRFAAIRSTAAWCRCRPRSARRGRSSATRARTRRSSRGSACVTSYDVQHSLTARATRIGSSSACPVAGNAFGRDGVRHARMRVGPMRAADTGRSSRQMLIVTGPASGV